MPHTHDDDPSSTPPPGSQKPRAETCRVRSCYAVRSVECGVCGDSSFLSRNFILLSHSIAFMRLSPTSHQRLSLFDALFPFQLEPSTPSPLIPRRPCEGLIRASAKRLPSRGSREGEQTGFGWMLSWTVVACPPWSVCSGRDRRTATVASRPSAAVTDGRPCVLGVWRR
jgi:hypothetical protein